MFSAFRSANDGIQFSRLDKGQSPPPVRRESRGWIPLPILASLGLAAVAFGGITRFQRPNSAVPSAESQEPTVTLQGITILERPNSAESQETTVPINQSLATTSSEPAAVPFPVAPPIAPAKVADSEDTVVSPNTQPKWPIESKTLEQLPKVIQDYHHSFLENPMDFKLSVDLQKMMEEGLYRCKDCLVTMAKENPLAILPLLIDIKVITLDIDKTTLHPDHPETISKLTDEGIVQTKPNSDTLTMAFVMPRFTPDPPNPPLLWHQLRDTNDKISYLNNILAKLGKRLDKLKIDSDDKTKILSFLKTDNVTILSLIKDNHDLHDAILENTNELQKELYIKPALARADEEKADMKTTLKKL